METTTTDKGEAEMSPHYLYFVKTKTQYTMSKMGQDGRSDDLKKMIEVSERTERNHVFFLGKQYTLSDAKQILIFMQDAERKIHRNKQSSK